MPRLSATDAPAPFAATVCVLVFAACFFSLRSMPRYLARQRLEEKAERMQRMGGKAVESAEGDLQSLPGFEKLNCHAGSSDVLAQQSFKSMYVLWFAVIRNGSILCASSNLRVKTASPVRILDETWSTQVVEDPGGKNYYAAIHNRGELQYVAIIDPLLLEVEMASECPDCVSYEVVVNGPPQQRVRHGNAWNDAVLHCKLAAIIGATPMTLELVATQQFEDQFKWKGRLYAAVISAVGSLLLSYMLYGFLVRRRSVGNLIQQGIRRGEFIPYYQPIVDARDGSLLGAEALVRWRHKGKLIPPAQFISYAEETGLIGPITAQLVNYVLKDLKTLGWSGTHRYISINVVPDQITETPFCSTLIERLQAAGIPGRNLAVEITERSKLHDLEEGRRRLECLVAAGIDIKIDDAGTGFGGFSYVQELPVHTLKIDKMFIDTLRTEGDAKRQVLDAIIHFTQKSGLGAIAEGVETQEQVNYLLRMGVFAIQGYVYARPMPFRDLLDWIAARGVRIPAGTA
jgi:sensor c-di-GMP phosphodiesterase-like protein